MTAIGVALDRALELTGLSQRTLAERIGVKQPTISKWTRGESEPSLDTIADIEEALGLRRGYLLVDAGYVDGDLRSVEAAIDLTDDLSPVGKDAVKAVYRSLAGR